jgi:hypothetical protein
VVSSDGREDFLFDRGRSELQENNDKPQYSFGRLVTRVTPPVPIWTTHLDPVQYARVEDVDTSVNPVPDKLYGLFHESVDHGGSGFGDNDTVSRRLGYFGDHDRSLTTMSSVEVSESLEWVSAGDVRVEDEEGRIVFSEDFTSEGKRSGGTEGFGLHAESNGDTVILFGLLEHGDHNFGSVVDGENDVLDTSFD